MTEFLFNFRQSFAQNQWGHPLPVSMNLARKDASAFGCEANFTNWFSRTPVQNYSLSLLLLGVATKNISTLQVQLTKKIFTAGPLKFLHSSMQSQLKSNCLVCWIFMFLKVAESQFWIPIDVVTCWRKSAPKH